MTALARTDGAWRPVAAVVVLLAGCGRDDPPPGPPSDPAPWNAATWRLLGASTADVNARRNCGLFVPALLPPLAALAEGAKGATRAEFMQLLGPLELDGIVRRLHALGRREGLEFTVGARAWIDEQLPIDPAWQRRCRAGSKFGAELEPFDFRGDDLGDLAGEINDFISDRVEREVRPASAALFTRDTRLVLASAGRTAWEWQVPFDPEETRPGPFFLGPGRTEPKQVPMIRDHERHTQAFTLDGRLVARLAGKGGLWFDLIEIGADPAARAAVLGDGAFLAGLDDALRAAKPHTVSFAFPKVELGALLDLKSVLLHAGLSTSFESSADFSGLAGAPGDLMLGDLLHGFGIRWDEQGGEAWGFTISEAVTAAMNVDEAVFDEPFLALLREGDGAILAAAWIAEP